MPEGEGGRRVAPDHRETPPDNHGGALPPECPLSPAASRSGLTRTAPARSASVWPGEQRDFVTVVEVADLRRTADALVGVVNLIHHTMVGWNPAPGSVAAIDLANAETGRGDTPWGPTPVETFVTVTSGTALMMTDHLHAASLTLRDDNDFGPLATARCTLEAAGRVLWLLGTGDEESPPAPSVVDVRSRVERSLAVRLRGLRHAPPSRRARVRVPKRRRVAQPARRAFGTRRGGASTRRRTSDPPPTRTWAGRGDADRRTA